MKKTKSILARTLSGAFAALLCAAFLRAAAPSARAQSPITISMTNGLATVLWTGAATLQEAAVLTGNSNDWQNVIPAPVGNSYTVPAESESLFFRAVPFAAPSSITAFTCTIASGNGPFATNGVFSVTTAGTHYSIIPISGSIAPSSGTYSYGASGVTGTANITDAAYGPGTVALTFTSATAGTYVITFAAAPGATETGTFTTFAAPAALTAFTCTIASGNGPFATNGVFSVITAESNYTITPISGSIAPGLGTYSYAASGVTGTASITDAAYGPGTVALTFTTATSGTYLITFAAAPGATETGTFTTFAAPLTITAFTCTIGSGNGPFATNGVFSVITSGSHYTITPISESVANSSGAYSYAASGVTGTASLTDSIGGPGTVALTFTTATSGTYVITFAAAPGASETGTFTIFAAPQSITAFTCTIASGNGPFATNGVFSVITSGSHYTITPISESVANSSGTYSYAASGVTGTASLTDSIGGPGTVALNFTTATSGTYVITFAAAPGASETGTFTTFAAPQSITAFTCTIASGNGPFATNGVFSVITSGSHYNITPISASVANSSGTYSYAASGVTGTASLTDSIGGPGTVALNFTTATSGTYVITFAAAPGATETGTFSTFAAPQTITAFTCTIASGNGPFATNGVFSVITSGSHYNITPISASVANSSGTYSYAASGVTGTASISDSIGGPGTVALTFTTASSGTYVITFAAAPGATETGTFTTFAAPQTITAFTCTIASGNGPFATNGVFSVITSGSHYTITPISESVANSSGTYSYAASGVTGTASLTDSIGGPGTVALTFTTASSGTYVITFAAAPGATETGTFTTFAAPQTITAFTCTIASGNGPFASSGVFSITSSGSSHYTITPLSGPVAPSSGTYAYTASGVTGTASVSDSIDGPGMVALNFTSATGGTYVITFAAAPGASQTGTFTTFAAPTTISGLDFTIASGNGPFATNGVFSITSSGSHYAITPLSGPVAPSSGTYAYAASGVSGTASVSDSIDGPGMVALNFTSATGGTYVITFAAAPGASQTGTFTTFAAPSSLSSLTCTIASGNGPFASSGVFSITTSGSNYTLTPISGLLAPSAGTYSYAASGVIGTATIADANDGPGILELMFTTASSGTFVITIAAAPGASETGTFTMP